MKRVLEPKDSRAFQVSCSAIPVGSFRNGADSLSVTIGQRIRRFGSEEMWDSVVVQCRQEGGALTVRVLVCSPNWDRPLQIASIGSQPTATASGDQRESLEISLEHGDG